MIAKEKLLEDKQSADMLSLRKTAAGTGTLTLGSGRHCGAGKGE